MADSQNPPSPNAPPSSEPHVCDLIEITVKTIDSKNYQFQVENDMKIRAFKERIASQVGIELENQRIIFCGRVLADDKTFKDYNIDNGKVVHLVKRALPSTSRATSGSNNESNITGNTNRSPFSFPVNEDGIYDGAPIFMGTISLDSSGSFINQIARQIFRPGTGTGITTTGPNNSNQTASSGNSSNSAAGSNTSALDMHNRIAHVRRFLHYVQTNFQILENPQNFPPPMVTRSQDNTSQEVPQASDFIALFNDWLTALDRLRPHLNSYLQSISNQPSAENIPNVQSNHSLLMRICHHLAHAWHTLSEFNIDYSRANMPLSLHVLPRYHNIRRSNNNSNNSNSNSVSNTSAPELAARIEVSTSTGPIPLNLPPNFSAPTRGVFSHPILLMEVDATAEYDPVDLDRSRPFDGMPTPSIPSTPNRDGQAPNSNSADIQPQTGASFSTQQISGSGSRIPVFVSTYPPVVTTVSTGSTGSSTTSHSSSVSSSATNTTSHSSSNTSSSRTSVSSTAPNRQRPSLPFTFDPYLACNSAYTMPELRTATAPGFTSMRNEQPTMGIETSSGHQEQQQNSEQNDGNNAMGFDMTNPIHNIVSDMFEALWEAADAEQASRPQSNSPQDFPGDLSQMFEPFLNSFVDRNSTNQNRLPFTLANLVQQMNVNMNQSDGATIANIWSTLARAFPFEEFASNSNILGNDMQRVVRHYVQSFIRSSLFSSEDVSGVESIRSNVERIIPTQNNALAQSLVDTIPLAEVNINVTLSNFLRETFTQFFVTVMQPESDDNFTTVLYEALRHLSSCFHHFFRVNFADYGHAIRQFLRNVLTFYLPQLLPELQTVIVNFLVTQINNSPTDQTIENLVNSFTVRTNNSVTTASNLTSVPPSQEISPPEVESENQIAPDNISLDSEAEFADAISDGETFAMDCTPSRSQNQSLSQLEPSRTATDESSNWQSVMPNEWVPIINEDLNKQNNINQNDQRSFSEAYINGMSKKRRIEHQQDNDKKPK